jgi:hypothetical protein
LDTAEFNNLGEVEKRHFYKCNQYEEMVDMRQLAIFIALEPFLMARLQMMRP